MIVPCMVNSWLYCSGVRNCIPGRASSARMNRAIRPPIMNQVNEVAMYISPRTLGSVVCKYCRNLLPSAARCTGYGRDTTRRGATAVTLTSQQVGALTEVQAPPTFTDASPNCVEYPISTRSRRRGADCEHSPNPGRSVSNRPEDGPGTLYAESVPVVTSMESGQNHLVSPTVGVGNVRSGRPFAECSNPALTLEIAIAGWPVRLHRA